MADEDAGAREEGADADRERVNEDVDGSPRSSAGRARPADDPDAGTSLGFSLPPISLPDVRLPERVRLVFPVPEPPEKVDRPVRVEASWVLLGVVLADALDALAVAWAGPAALAWTRAAVGVLLAVVLVGLPGLLYAWELLAVVAGFGALSLAPTLTALVVVKLLLAR